MCGRLQSQSASLGCIYYIDQCTWITNTRSYTCHACLVCAQEPENNKRINMRPVGEDLFLQFCALLSQFHLKNYFKMDFSKSNVPGALLSQFNLKNYLKMNHSKSNIP